VSILKGGVADSIEQLRRQAAGGSRAQRSVQLYIKADSSVKIRFLQEPTAFMQYQEHYDEAQKMFVPAIENDPLDQHPNEKTRRTSQKWLVNCLNVEDGRVHLVKLNQDLVTRVLTRYQKYGTICDRNYEIIRTGGSRETKYDLEGDDVSQIDLARFQAKMHDPTSWLLGEVDTYYNTNHQEEYLAQKEQNQQLPGVDAPAAAPPTQEAPPVVPPTADELAAARRAKEQAELDEKYGVTPPWDDQPTTDPAPSPGPQSTTTGSAPSPTADEPAPPPRVSSDAPGMAEIAAQTTTSGGSAQLSPEQIQQLTQAVTSVATADTATAVAPEDPWAKAASEGQPCRKGDDGKCQICGFDVSECLIKS